MEEIRERGRGEVWRDNERWGGGGGDEGLGHTLADGLHCGTVVECMMPETETVEQR